jgi:hypothetical protein
MADPFGHERPVLLVLKEGESPAEGFRAFVGHPEVVAWSWPSLWSLEAAGADLAGALHDVREVALANLDRVLAALVARCDRAALERLVAETWAQADERVRAFFLRRGAIQVMASAFRLAPRSAEFPPPPAFVADRVHEHAFTMEYRLRREAGAREAVAPPEEGTLAFYPFDPADAAGRREAALDGGAAPVLELFAYDAGRARHRRVLEDVAARRGWRVAVPAALRG